jgi:hypothetical protein
MNKEKKGLNIFKLNLSLNLPHEDKPYPAYV